MTTRIMKADNEALQDAVRLLRAGELVAFPTETVYGLGADARSDQAVAKIYTAKGRPSGNPIIVHVSTTEDARKCAAVGAWNENADILGKRFWPGPLTIIVRRGVSLSSLVSAGGSTVGLRCPAHPMAMALLRDFGGPVAAPSANRSGFTSPTTAAHVLAELSGHVPLILDGGACTVGVESTVVDVSGETPAILRPGAITVEMLREVIGPVKTPSVTVNEEDSAASPGQHARHYAPRTTAYRLSAEHWDRAQEWAARHSPVVLLTHAETFALPSPHETILLPGDEGQYARVLYAALRQADEKGFKAILIMIPAQKGGLWVAIADRLRRATVDLPIE